MKPYNENIELKEFLVKYKENWNEFFKKWEKDPKATFEEDVIWNNRKGKGETELECDVFPQPYLGNIHDHSVITLNLNPSRSKKGVKKFNLKNGEKGNENDVFEEKHLQEFLKKPKKDYYEYAKGFPTYDIDFWQNQKNWIDRIFKKLGKDAPSENKIKPFAIEICPWGSKKFQNLKIKKDDPLIKYMDQHVFDVIEKVNQKNIFPSKIKLVPCVGKDYYDIFNHNNSDFEKLSEFTKSNKTNNEVVVEPETLDKNFVLKIKEKWPLNKNNVLTNRCFSFWKKNSMIHYNVYSTEGGANNPPGKDFKKVEQEFFRIYKSLITK